MQPDYKNILLVDDDAVVRAVTADLLKPLGFKVYHARNGTEALQMVAETCPQIQIVITDWVMAGMNGIEFCRQLRAMNLSRYVYVILLTAKTEQEDLITGLRAGADDFLTKPVSPGELTARLQTAHRILELESRLKDLARRDPLTGAVNRRTFYEMLQREIARSVRHNTPLSCAMVDADYFKKINDTYGHMVGDQVLRFLAQLLIRMSRLPDCVCRWGGEEFCILLPDTDEKGALSWANRCCQALAATPFYCHGTRLTITASFGVAQWSNEIRTAEALIERADQALYMAKNKGRRQAVSYSSLLVENSPSTLAHTI